MIFFSCFTISAVQQSENRSVCAHIPSLLRLPPTPAPQPSRSLTEHQAELPAACGNFLLVLDFIYGSVSAAYHPDHDFSPSSWVSFLVDGLLLSSLLI